MVIINIILAFIILFFIFFKIYFNIISKHQKLNNNLIISKSNNNSQIFENNQKDKNDQVISVVRFIIEGENNKPKLLNDSLDLSGNVAPCCK